MRVTSREVLNEEPCGAAGGLCAEDNPGAVGEEVRCMVRQIRSWQSPGLADARRQQDESVGPRGDRERPLAVRGKSRRECPLRGGRQANHPSFASKRLLWHHRTRRRFRRREPSNRRRRHPRCSKSRATTGRLPWTFPVADTLSTSCSRCPSKGRGRRARRRGRSDSRELAPRHGAPRRATPHRWERGYLRWRSHEPRTRPRRSSDAMRGLERTASLGSKPAPSWSRRRPA